MRNKFILLALMAFCAMLLLSQGAWAKSLFYADNASELASAGGLTTGSAASHRKLVTGQCNVQSITLSGVGSTAADYVKVYDGTDNTGTLRYEISVGVASDTTQLMLNDAQFGTGVYVEANNDLLFLTVEYTQQ